jgi:hypothetical protein
VKVTASATLTHNPCGEADWASGLRENFTSRSYGEGLETGRIPSQAPRQSFTRQTNFYVAQGTCAMEMPRAWSATAIERRISLALLAGSLLKAIAAACDPLPMGPWDLKAVASAGRLANHLATHSANFVALALHGLAPRTYRKITAAKETPVLQLPLAA